jgi:hypothetical protein
MSSSDDTGRSMFPYIAIAFLLFLLVGTVYILSSRPEQEKPAPSTAPVVPVAPPKQEAQRKVEAQIVPGSAVISGTVRFQGTPPSRRTIDYSSSADCKAVYADRPLYKEDIIVANGCLKNVLVYVKHGAENWKGTLPKTAVMIAMKDFVFAPHVVALCVDQPLEMVPVDDVPHNPHILAGDNPEFCESQQKAGLKKTKICCNPEIGGRIVCNIHNWMSATFHVLPHPFFAITGDDGTFKIDGIPPGEYEFEAWQESEKLDGPHSLRVKLADGDRRNVDFTFKMK